MDTRGFSLIELMMVLTIIAIFITFTYPSYQEAIIRSRRLDGQTALIDLANRMEHYFSEHHSYEGATLGKDSNPGVIFNNHSHQNWYRLVIKKQSRIDYNLQAIPIGSQGKKDKACQTLGLDSLGQKTVLGGPAGFPKSTVDYCWF